MSEKIDDCFTDQADDLEKPVFPARLRGAEAKGLLINNIYN